MISVYVQDDGDEGEVEVTFRFSGANPDELTEASVMLQAARQMAPPGTRLGVELDAHRAYFEALAYGLRELAVSK